MQEHIRRRQDGTIDHDFYRARACAERRSARCAAIRTLVRLFHSMAAGSFSFPTLATAHL